jgi:hypothetical protein
MSFYLCNLPFAHGGVATLGSTVSMLPPHRAHLAAGQREPLDFTNCHSLAPAAFRRRCAAPGRGRSLHSAIAKGRDAPTPPSHRGGGKGGSVLPSPSPPEQVGCIFMLQLSARQTTWVRL